MNSIYTGKLCFDLLKGSHILSTYYDTEIKHIGYSDDSFVYYIPSKNIVVKCIAKCNNSCEIEINEKLYKSQDSQEGLIKPLNMYSFTYIRSYMIETNLVKETTEYVLFEYEYIKYNLENFFEKSSKLMLITIKKKIINQVIKGISNLHTLGYYHGDLKPKNICISEDGETVKIIDYGLCDLIEYKNSEKYFKNTIYSASPFQLARHIQEYNSLKHYLKDFKKVFKTKYNQIPCITTTDAILFRETYRESCIKNDWFGVGLLIYFILSNGNHFFIQNTKVNSIYITNSLFNIDLLKDIINNTLTFLDDPTLYCKNKQIDHFELYESYLLNNYI